jgi:hypothetical protein
VKGGKMKVKFNEHTGELSITQYHSEEGYNREDTRTWSREKIKNLYFMLKRDLAKSEQNQKEQMQLRAEQDELRKKQDIVAIEQMTFFKELLKGIETNYPTSKWADDTELQAEGTKTVT